MSQESIAFRGAELADFPGLALLIERANALRDQQPVMKILEGTDTLENLVAKSKKPGVWTEIALQEGKLVGFSLGYPASETSDLSEAYIDAEYISLLMVDPDHWGKRIASKLLDRAAEKTRHDNKHQLILLTRESDNEHARQVYEHKGYVPTGDTRVSKYGKQVLYVLNL